MNRGRRGKRFGWGQVGALRACEGKGGECITGDGEERLSPGLACCYRHPTGQRDIGDVDTIWPIHHAMLSEGDLPAVSDSR